MTRAPVALIIAVPLVLAGCVTSPTDDVSQAGLTDVLAPLTSILEVAMDGTITPGAVACVPTGTCEGLLVPGTERLLEPEFEGILTGTNLTLTWDPSSPAMERLRLGLVWGPDGEHEFEIVEGVSPLLLETAGLEITPGDEPEIFVWLVETTPAVESYVSTGQDFRLEGGLVIEAPLEDASAAADGTT